MTLQIQKRTGQESNYNAYRLARTENMKALNSSALDRYRALGYTKVKEIVTTDERTSDECLEHVGLVWSLDVPYLPTLPRRPNCRCTWAPVTDHKFKGLSIGNIESNNNNVEIEIDEKTPCLVRQSDGAILKTHFKEITVRNTQMNGWLFNWEKQKQHSDFINALYVENDKRIQGMVAISYDHQNRAVLVDLVESAPHNRKKDKDYTGVGAHLFAEACRLSLNSGYDGVVYFQSKTKLINYYKKELLAKHIGNGRMVIYEEESRQLIEKYYGEK